MKKLLALVLALVMTLSLCVVSSNAAFADAADIEHDEAVDVLTTLGVTAGKGNNKFDPAANVTRAEMAKMISIIMLGDVDAAAFVGTSTGLKDVAGHWAEGYIQYCYSQGIIAGKGAGLFDPNANVTATEAAKMLLGAIGYNAKVQGYEGADWAINVTRDAQLSNFYDDLDGLVATKAMTRDQAAQMIYNAICTKTVEKSPTLTLGTNEISYHYTATGKPLMTLTFKAIKVVGVVEKNEFTDNTGLKGKTYVRVTNFGVNEEQSVLNSGNYKVATTPDMIGMSVTMYVKPWGTNSSNVTKATVLGTPYVNDNNQVYTTTSALIDDATKSNDVTKTLKNAGLQIQAADLYENYVDKGTNLAANATAYENATGDGFVVDFIDNDADGKVDIVRQLKKDFGEVLTASTAGDGKLAVKTLGSANFALNTTEANEDVADFASLNLAKNDYVFYYKVSDTYYVEKVEGTTVTVTSTKGAGALCKVNGTYTKSDLASGTDMSAAAGNQQNLDDAVTVGKSAVLYLDAYGYVVYVDAVADSGNYLMVTGIDTYSQFDGSLKMKVVKEDGTTDTVKIASLKEGATTWKVGTLYVKAGIGAATEAASGQTRGANPYGTATNVYGGEYFADNKLSTAQVYSYSVNDKGEYALTVPTGAGNAPTTTITKGNASSVATKLCNAATIFVVKTGSSWTTYTGIGNVPTLTPQTVYFVDNTAGTIKILFVTSNLAAVNNNVVVFASNAPTITDDKGSTVYTYDVIYKNAITTLTADATSNTTISGAPAGLYYGVVATDGKITATGTPVAKQEVTAFDGQYISTAIAAGNTGYTTYGVDDATKVFVVTSGEAAEGTVADITVKDVAVAIAGSNVVIVARDTTGADQYMADTIVIYK